MRAPVRSRGDGAAAASATDVDDRVLRRAVGGRRDGRGGVAFAVRQVDEPTRAEPLDDEHDQRHGQDADDDRAIDDDAGRVGDEQRDRHQHEVEAEVEQHAGHEPEAQVDEPPHERRHEQLDRPRVRRLSRIVRVRAAEHDRLQHQRDDDERLLVAEAATEQRRARERHRAEQRLLHHPGLQRHRHRPEPRQRLAEDVRIDERVGRRPPAEVALDDEVEGRDEREVEADPRVAREGAAPHRARRGGRQAPHAPQLRMVAEREAAEAFGRREDDRQQQPRDDAADERTDDAGDAMRRGRRRGVVAEPAVRDGRQRRAGDEQRDDRGPLRRRRPAHRMPAHQPDQADEAAAEAVDDAGDDARGRRDVVVRRTHRLVASREGLRHVDEALQLHEAIAGDDEPQPQPAGADRRCGLEPPLVDELVVDALAGLRLRRRGQRPVAREVDAPVARRGRRRDGPRVVRRQRRAGLGLGHLAEEADRPAGRRERDLHLALDARREQPHAPAIEAELVVEAGDAGADERLQRRLAAAFELDERLRAGVAVEARGRLRQLGRREVTRGGQPLRVVDRRRARHRHVQVEHRERVAEPAQHREQAQRRGDEHADPENGLAGEARGHGSLSLEVAPTTMRERRAAIIASAPIRPRGAAPRGSRASRARSASRRRPALASPSTTAARAARRAMRA